MADNMPSNIIMYPANVPELRLYWIFASGDAITSSPVVADGVVYIGSRDHNVYALAARTGEELWSYKTGGNIISSPAIVDGIVYIGSDDGSLYAFHQVHKPAEDK
jgi:eukaryotic-like serine/threonine-protein kinase